MDWPKMTEGECRWPIARSTVLCVCIGLDVKCDTEASSFCLAQQKWVEATPSLFEQSDQRPYRPGRKYYKPSIPVPAGKYYTSAILLSHHAYGEWTVQGLFGSCSPYLLNVNLVKSALSEHLSVKRDSMCYMSLLPAVKKTDITTSKVWRKTNSAFPN